MLREDLLAVQIQCNDIAADLYRLVDTLDPCGVCGRPCIDQDYSPYLLCSAKCDLIADAQVDEAQQDD